MQKPENLQVSKKILPNLRNISHWFAMNDPVCVRVDNDNDFLLELHSHDSEITYLNGCFGVQEDNFVIFRGELLITYLDYYIDVTDAVLVNGNFTSGTVECSFLTEPIYIENGRIANVENYPIKISSLFESLEISLGHQENLRDPDISIVSNSDLSTQLD